MSVSPLTSTDWVQHEGELVDGAFPLEQYLGGNNGNGVFLTHFGAERAVIKLVSCDPEEAARMVDRWNRTAALTHPHLLKIYGRGTWTSADATFAYLVMEYAEENLAAVLSARRLSADETREMLLPVADALTYLHREGVVHGSIKPSNILASGDTVKISCDTVARGDPSDDVVALASTMVEALTQQPFALGVSGNSAIAGTLPHPFREVAENCLRPERGLRWTSSEVAHWLRSPGRSAQFNANTARVPGSSTRKPKIAYYLAAVASLCFAVTLWSLFTRRTKAVDSAENAPPPASVAQPSAIAASPALPAPVPKAEVPAKASRKRVPRNEGPAPEGIVKEVLPEIPALARSTIRGKATVTVDVTVDPSGNVIETALQPQGSRYFGKFAIEAARQWQFAPTGQPGKWTIRFEITRGAMTATSNQRG